ncbi:MAG: hypothetical protein AAGJ11_06210 [Bacteroidota bacterium]
MRTYSEKQVADIIERAVERQKAADEGDASPGLTLDEIERLGREAGIDPAHLRAAAEEVDAAGRTLTRQRSQTRTQVVVERWIDAPLTSAGWEDVVARLREFAGPGMGAALGQDAGGSVQQVGETYEWSHTSGLGVQTRVSVSPRGGRTRLRMTQLVGLSSPTVEGIGYGGLIATLVAVIGGGTTVAFAGLEGAFAALAMAAMFLVSWIVAAPLVTVADRRWRARKLNELDALADDLAPMLAQAASEQAASEQAAADAEASASVPAPEAARLDLDALGDAPEAESQSNGRQRTR